MKLTTAVRKAVKDLDLEDRDQGAAELALTYARAVDNGADLQEHGPLLLAVLEALLMTPKARAAAMKGGARGSTGSPLDELRARRAARADRAEAVDTSTS